MRRLLFKQRTQRELVPEDPAALQKMRAPTDNEAVDEGADHGAQFDSLKMAQPEEGKGEHHAQQAADAVIAGFEEPGSEQEGINGKESDEENAAVKGHAVQNCRDKREQIRQPEPTHDYRGEYQQHRLQSVLRHAEREKGQHLRHLEMEQVCGATTMDMPKSAASIKAVPRARIRSPRAYASSVEKIFLSVFMSDSVNKK